MLACINKILVIEAYIYSNEYKKIKKDYNANKKPIVACQR